MRLCIAGSRGISGEKGRAEVRAAVREAMNRFQFSMADVTEIVSGMCKDSPDMIGADGAERSGIRLKPFPAKWEDLDVPGAVVRTRRDGIKYNLRAGLVRNTEMALYLAEEPDSVCVIVWDGASPGSKHMGNECHRLGVLYHLYVVRPF